MKPTLFVLAAGMGSRYGGLKQLDGLGPNGETIMDYSIFDAIRGGFGKVVFVIRKDFEADFRTKILSKYENHIPVEVVFQSVDDLPEGFVRPEGRTKPWGTNHAVLMGKAVIREPFAVINADDFYGRDGFRVLGQWLSKADGENRYCMVGYRVGNTLSESGTVARGICRTDANNYLTGVVERTDIARVDGRITFTGDDGQPTTTDDNTPVSMNMWGFTASVLKEIDARFAAFLDRELPKNPIKCEYFLPFVVDELLKEGKADVTVLKSIDRWYGVTYKEDKETVVNAIKGLKEAGFYPEKLWEEA